jgi:DNA repair protein RecO (recombination protein O)
MRYQNVQAIVLKKTNIGENDQYVTLYSPDLGKFDAIAKGSRKIISSFGGHLEVLNICSMQVYKSSHRYTITQCQTLHCFKNLRSNLQLSLLAFLILEIFYRITPTDEQDEELFELVQNTLEMLSKDCKKSLIIESFKIKLLSSIGALPDISECFNCHKKWTETENIYIDDDYKISCKKCICGNDHVEKISFNIMKLINYILNRPIEAIEKINLKKTDELELKKIADHFLQTYLNFDLNSEKIAEQILI